MEDFIGYSSSWERLMRESELEINYINWPKNKIHSFLDCIWT